MAESMTNCSLRLSAQSRASNVVKEQGDKLGFHEVKMRNRIDSIDATGGECKALYDSTGY